MRRRFFVCLCLVIPLCQGVAACAVPLQSPAPAAATAQETLPAASGSDSLFSEIFSQVSPARLFKSIGDLSGEWPVEIGGELHTLASRDHLNGDSILKATQYVYEHLQIPGLTVTYFYWQLPVGVVTNRLLKNNQGVIARSEATKQSPD